MAKPNVIIIEKPFGGWIPTYSGALATRGAHEGTETQYTESTAISLFRTGYFGHIAPGEAYTAITDASTKINETPLNGDVASTGKAFVVLRNGRLVRLAVGGGSTDLALDPTLAAPNHGSHTITAGYNGDVLVMKDAAGTEYILWSWMDGSDGDISIVTPTGSSVTDDDWFSTLTGAGAGLLTTGVPLKLWQGPDGNVYCTNGQYVATATMSAGVALTAATGNKRALNLGAGWTAAGGTPFGKYSVIIAYSGGYTASGATARGRVRVFLWNGYAPEPNFIYDIPDNFASAICTDGSNLFAFTQGRNNSSKIWIFGEKGFKLHHESSLYQMSVSGEPKQGAIEAYQNGLVFNGNDDETYQLFSGGLHQRTAFTASRMGMVKNLYSGDLYFGISTGSNTHYIYTTPSGYYVNAVWKSRLYQLPFLANIDEIGFNFSQFGSGASITVKVFEGYDTTAGTPRASFTLTNAESGTTYDLSEVRGVHGITSFYLQITFDHASTADSAAQISRIEVYYSSTDKN